MKAEFYKDHNKVIWFFYAKDIRWRINPSKENAGGSKDAKA